MQNGIHRREYGLVDFLDGFQLARMRVETFDGDPV